MPKADLDWTFDDGPADERAKPGQSTRPQPREPARWRPAPAAKPRRARRALRAVALGVLTLGLLAAAITWLGWQRLCASLQHEIAYEDQQALAGQVEAVLARQAGDASDDAWRTWRAAHVGAGLASLAPASNLRPLAEPPQLLRLGLSDGTHFEAAVGRAFADSSGQRFTFEYQQRYVQLGPDTWASLPPDTASLSATSHWASPHISATFPLADSSWMLSALPQVDGYVARACADWSCPLKAPVSVIFSRQLPPIRPEANQSPAGLAGGYPLIFDIAARQPRYARQLILTSPHLAGLPHDAAASQALVRAITASLLGQLAVNLAQAGGQPRNIYLDALVARSELRLKLSAAPAASPQPGDFATPSQFWLSLGSHQMETGLDLADRLQALSLIQSVLVGQPARAEAALLPLAGTTPGLLQWLALGLGAPMDDSLSRWWLQTASAIASAHPANFSQLNGLAYICPSGGWLVRGGQPRPLPLDPATGWLPHGALSPDGRWLVTTQRGAIQINIVELALSQSSGLPGQGWPIGWLPDGRLVYVEAPTAGASFGQPYRFLTYDPATGAQSVLGERPISPPDPAAGLSALRQQWAYTQIDAANQYPFERPAVLALGRPLSAQAADFNGSEPALSPDGRWLAYVPLPDNLARAGPWPPAHLAIFDRETGQSQQVLISESLPAAELLHDPASLAWSPNGTQLAFIVHTGAGDTRLMRLKFARQGPGAGADLREIAAVASPGYIVGYSADGRYLAVADDGPEHIAIVALDTVRVVARAASAGWIAPQSSAVWAPTGHWLAVAGPAGLYVLDPATGSQQWVASGYCQPAWYDLRAGAR